MTLRRIGLGLALVGLAALLGYGLSLAAEPLGLEAVFAAAPAEGARHRPPDPWRFENFPGLIGFACAALVAARLLLEGVRLVWDGLLDSGDR